MKWSRRSQGFLSTVALVAGIALGLTACEGSYSGGGFIDSFAGAPAKATFGGTVHVIDINPDPNIGQYMVKMGQFQWVDHGTGVRFHVKDIAGPIYGTFYPDLFNPVATLQVWSGTYSCPEGVGTVEFGLGLKDPEWAQIFGSSLNDAASMRVTSGPYQGYYNVGLIKGGNVIFNPAVE